MILVVSIRAVRRLLRSESDGKSANDVERGALFGVRMDSPYDEPWGVGAGSEGGGGGNPSAGEVPTIAAVIVLETVIIAGLLFFLWWVSVCHARLPVRLCRSCDREEG